VFYIMVNFTAFYYARSFACFTKPNPIIYHRAPRYLRAFNQGYLTSAPFILNYLNKKYKLSNTLTLTQPPLSLQMLTSAYRSVLKPFRRLFLPVVFADARSIASYYYPDRRLLFYKAFFFKRFFFAFFTYRTSQNCVFIASSVLFRTN